MFSRIFIILFFILIFPLNACGFNENMDINNIEEKIKLTGLNYEAKISKLRTDILCLEDKKDEKVTLPDEKKGNEDLEKRIKELEAKLEKTTKDYETQLNVLKSSLEELKKEQQSLTDKIDINQALQQVTEPEEIPESPSRQAYQSQNPDISIVGDILFSNVNSATQGLVPHDLTHHEHEGKLHALHSDTDEHHHSTNDFQLRELEIGFQGVLDPYARADVFLGIHAGELHLEEGYMTLLNLPGSLQSRLGKFRVNFGRANKMHRPGYYLVDYPNMVKNFLGEEGLASVGVEGSYLLPIDTYVEMSGQVVTGGEGSPSFASEGNYIYLGHLKTFFELNENNSLEIGGTYAKGKYDMEHNLSGDLAGFDVTYSWNPTDDPYSSFILQSEVIFSRRELHDSNDKLKSSGYYIFGQYQLSRRVYLGLRYDYSEFPYNNMEYERAYSAALSFWPSDATRFRLQYTHTDRTFGQESNSIFLQTTFTLGPHKH
jgi:hypothetical protein